MTLTYAERDARAKAIEKAAASTTHRLVMGAIAPDLAGARLREFGDLSGIIDTADDDVFWNYHPLVTR